MSIKTIQKLSIRALCLILLFPLNTARGSSSMLCKLDCSLVSTPDQFNKPSCFLGSGLLRHEGDIAVGLGLRDGTIVTAGTPRDPSVRYWNIKTKSEITKLTFPPAAIKGTNCIALSPDESLVAVGNRDGNVWISSVERKSMKLAFSNGFEITALVFCGSNNSLAVGDIMGNLFLFDISKGVRIKEFFGHGSEISCIVFDKARGLIASGSSSMDIKLWDVDTSKCVTSFKEFGWPRKLAIASNGELLVSAGVGMPCVARNINTHEISWQVGSKDDSVYSMCPVDGAAQVIFAFCDGKIASVDATTGQVQSRLYLPIVHIQDVFSVPSSKCIGIAFGPCVQLFDLKLTYLGKKDCGHLGPVHALDFMPGSTDLLSGGGDISINRWSVNEARVSNQFFGHRAWVHGISNSEDGSLFACSTSDGMIQVWNAKNGNLLWQRMIEKNHLVNFAFSAKNNLIAIGTTGRKILLVDGTTGSTISEIGNVRSETLRVAFDKRGQLLGAILVGGALQIWNVAAGVEIAHVEGLDHDLKGLVLRESEQTALVVTSKYIYHISLFCSTVTRKTEFSAKGAIFVSLSQDGAFLGAALSDKEFVLLTTNGANTQKHFELPCSQVTSLAVDREGCRIAAGAANGLVYVWDLAVARKNNIGGID